MDINPFKKNKGATGFSILGIGAWGMDSWMYC